ncbi:MAG: type II toxin-antitoxin system RelE/ParE family toxin [Mesorhizobium sp.]|nr:type II toxin-antitoxin system RelE/ParE family toxin [Mesorhizobium sp.]
MLKLRYSSEALDNIADIAVHIARASGSVVLAERVSGDIRKRCRRLASLPGTLGRARNELREELRSIAFNNFVIFFRYDNGALEIVAVLEGHRDILAYFDDDEI